MKEELSQVTVEAMKALMENLTQAKGFILEQAPSVLQEMVLVQRIKMTTAFFAAVLLLLIAPILFKRYSFWEKVYQKRDNQAREADQKSEAYGFFACAAVCLGLLVMAISFPYLITVWFAPKVYLLGEISKLLK